MLRKLRYAWNLSQGNMWAKAAMRYYHSNRYSMLMMRNPLKRAIKHHKRALKLSELIDGEPNEYLRNVVSNSETVYRLLGPRPMGDEIDIPATISNFLDVRESSTRHPFARVGIIASSTGVTK
jgi:hypothetical protein